MGRNKLVYGLADWAVVVSASSGQGGTWAGAVEALRARWTPTYVREDRSMPEGNARLIEKGASPFPTDFDDGEGLADHLERLSQLDRTDAETIQLTLPI